MTTARKISPSTANSAEENESITASGYDPFKQSNLFHEVYLNVEVPHKFNDLWNPRDPKEFDNFCNDFRNLCANYDFKDFESWSEMDTIQNWIIPVLEMLGYYDKCDKGTKPFSLDSSFTYEKKSLRPDFIVVDRPTDLKRIKSSDNSPEQKLSEAREYVKLTIEAKYWDRLEEYKQNNPEDKKRADNKKPNASESKDPVEQALEYMKMLHNDWGILTDGKVWRLYHRELSDDAQKRCFQFNLGYLTKFAQNGLSDTSEEQKLFIENAKYFYYLFNKNAIFGKEGKGKLLDHLIEYSKDYVHKIEDDLRNRFVQAMTTFCNGFHESMGKPKSEEKLDIIRNVSESHLFNIMFIKSCESRLILPMKGDYVAKSLTRMVQCLKKYKPERGFDDHNLEMLQRAFGNQTDENAFDFSWDGTELYERLLDLTEFIQKGTNAKFKNFKIAGFTETVFSKEEWVTAQKFKVTNKFMVAALFQIGYAKPDHKITKYQQIPYNFFTARQLGSIYESFLEFKIDFAETDLAFIKKQWITAKIKSDRIAMLNVPCAEKGTLFFTPNNDKRKETGAYYTPDNIVQYIVEEAISPHLKNKDHQEISKIKICDPAMGSGHFINASLNFLSKKYLEAYERENFTDEPITIQDAKCKILHNCIYGVDINPRATKLAKMGLWLESAKAGTKLEELDDQIKCANSLTDLNLWKNEWKFLTSGIDVVVGNPPYLGQKGNKEIFQEIKDTSLGKRFHQRRMDLFYFFFHLGLDILKTNGTLGFISTNYFLNATYADKLRLDIKERSSVLKLLNFGRINLFKSAAGQHNAITILKKSQDENLEVTTCVTSRTGEISNSELLALLQGKDKKTTFHRIPQSSLFNKANNEITLEGTGKNTSSGQNTVISKLEKIPNKLVDICNIDTGVQTGINKISKGHLKDWPNLKVKIGDGVFVLSKEELNSLSLNSEEKSLIKPCFKNSDISKWTTNEKSNESMIYYTSKKEYKSVPNIKKHLDKFKILLVNRNVREGTVSLEKYDKFVKGKDDISYVMIAGEMKKGNFYCVSYARNEENFIGEKIVCPQRSPSNTFGYNSVPWYPTSDVFTITLKDKNTFDLKYVLGVLNSKLYYMWLYQRGKRKGELLELVPQPLKAIPILKIEKQEQQSIVEIVKKIIEADKSKKDISSLENKLNALIYKIYKLSPEEIKTVEAFYLEHHGKAKMNKGESFDDAA